MSFRQLAWNNVKRNTRAYAAYFLSSSFAVMIFFSYAVFIFHPELLKTSIGSQAKTGMKAAEYVIFFFSFLFVLYSISAFLKARKKEFGILTILGAERKQLNGIIFIENMIIGFSSIATGVVSGLISSKLFLLFGSAMTGVEALPFYWPWKALGLTVFSFSALFIGISLFTTNFIRGQQALELLLGTSKPKQEPRASILLSILCVAYLAGSFYLTQHDLGETFLYVLGLGCVGTYLFFTQLSVFLVRLLKKNRSFFRRGINLLWVSEMAYKIKDNARMFFIITVVISMACGFASMIFSSEKQAQKEYSEQPFAIVYRNYDDNRKDESKKIDGELQTAGVKHEKISVNSITYPFKETSVPLMKLSDYNRLAKMYKLEEIPPLQENKAITIFNEAQLTKLTGQLQKETEQNQAIRELASNIGTFHVMGQRKVNILDPSAFIYIDMTVVSDTDYDRLVSSLISEGIEVSNSLSIYYAVPEWSTEQLPQEHSEEVEVTKKINDHFEENTILYLRALDYLSASDALNMMKFIWIFIAAIFSLSAVSFLYFKLYNDLQQDQRIYHSLSKIGLNTKEMNQAATIQIAILFFLPLLVAALGTVVTVSLISRQLGMSETFLPSMVAIGLFFAAQIIYFLLVRFLYIRQLSRVMV